MRLKTNSQTENFVFRLILILGQYINFVIQSDSWDFFLLRFTAQDYCGLPLGYRTLSSQDNFSPICRKIPQPYALVSDFLLICGKSPHDFSQICVPTKHKILVDKISVEISDPLQKKICLHFQVNPLKQVLKATISYICKKSYPNL